MQPDSPKGSEDQHQESQQSIIDNQNIAMFNDSQEEIDQLRH